MYNTVSPTPCAMDNDHRAFPVEYAQDLAPEVAAQLGNGHWVKRLPQQGAQPSHPNWIPVIPRQVNAIPVGRPCFERQVAKAPSEQELRLIKDEHLTGLLQDPDRGLAWYEAQVARRMEVEQRNEEYTLPELAPTLHNMQTFIAYILQGHQFDEPLTSSENQALQRLYSQAQEMLDLDVPYKRTLGLTFAFGTLYDLMAQQRVLEPLGRRQPALKKTPGRVPPLHTFLFACRQGHTKRQLALDTIDPLLLVSCHWYGLNPGGPDQIANFFCADHYSLKTFLPFILDRPSAFLHPSWEPLDVDDFCRLGHLPVYPIGLITAYAANADGCMFSPLGFMDHDVFHINFTKAFAYIEGERPLESPGNRCGFRQQMLNSLPIALASLQTRRAMELLVFSLLHEEGTCSSINMLEDKSFVPLMFSLAKIRRERWCAYSRSYQGITDAKATMAALWAHRLYTHWKAANLHMTQQQCNALADQFVAEDLPKLRWHLEYIARHRAPLCDLFLSESYDVTETVGGAQTKNRSFACATTLHLYLETFFHWQEPRGGCCVDHSDVLYFDRLHQDGGPEQIAQITGETIIHRTKW